jgi:hypothetical protein
MSNRSNVKKRESEARHVQRIINCTFFKEKSRDRTIKDLLVFISLLNLIHFSIDSTPNANHS